MRLCLLFAHEFTHVHLTKETGKIPEVIARQLGWRVEIVRGAGMPVETLANGMKEQIPHVELRTLKGRGDDRVEPAFLHFLARNAHKIDVLVLLHFGRNTATYGAWYKFWNPKGFVWNKLDLHEEVLKTIEFVPCHRCVSRTMWLQSRFLQAVDLVSTESSAGYRLLLERFPQLESKLATVPCGVDMPLMPLPTYLGPREPVILNVARLGTAQKATDVLLEAFAESQLWPQWKLVLVGAVEAAFRPWLDHFALTHPEVWPSVHLVGGVDSRLELANWYARSAVFCLPSRYESWGLALNEAGYYGCACIASKFYAALDMLDDGRCGALCEKGSVESLAVQLAHVCQNESLIHKFGTLFQQRVLDRYIWDAVIRVWHTEYIARQ